MKKAKDYAVEYRANPTEENLRNIVSAFIEEINELRDIRKAGDNAAVLSILDEQDRKWRAFARRIDGVRPDGFAEVVKLVHPGVYAVWRPEPREPISQAGKTLVSLAILGQMFREQG